MWNNIKINNDIYMISIIQKDDTIKILLTNLIEIWMETLTKELILNRCKKLNPLLCVEALNYNDIFKIFDNMSECIVEASVEQIKLRTQIEGGSMKFAINFVKGTSQDFWEIITKPLCMSSMEIIRQHKFLLDLVKKKDEEIAEYKAEGAELIRKNIKTKPFKEDQFKIAISTPNIIDCTNAFQRMVNFYNEFNLCTAASREPTSSNDRNEEIQKIEQNITSPVQGDNKSAHEVENVSIPRNIETTHLEDEKQSKDTINKKVTRNKKGTANIVYRPIKKLKKGLNDSIL